MIASSSLAGRAFLAVLLMIGFYVLAMAIAAGLIYIPYAEMVLIHRVHLKLALLCVIGALIILWSVLPRFDSFEAPGPALTRERHPRLFDELERVARAVGQEMPAEVYLVHDVNAWVTQRGGIMGFGSRRVMGLGLPLMRVLTCPQFSAVLAHEFGHYHGGDTKLGPWIYKTRGAIGRTLGSLGDGSIIQLPFLAYGKMFLRITHSISRQQEFVADALAARAIGSGALMGGLRTIHAVGPAFNEYWFNECGPVLNAGYRPPLTEGFCQFVRVGKIAEAIEKQLDEELKTGKADPYDTHPPLKERIAAVEHLPVGESGPNDPPATTLLNGVPELEQELMKSVAGPELADKLKPIDWSEAGVQVYLPQWTRLVQANTAVLTGLLPESLPHHAADLKGFGQRCFDHSGVAPAEEQAELLGAAVVGSALVVTLANKGAKAHAMPGTPISVSLGAMQFEPFEVMTALAKGTLTPSDWEQQCRDLGIDGVPLING